MDTYYEYIFKKKKEVRDYIINALVTMAAIILFHFLTVLILFGITTLVFLLPAIWFGIIWGAIKLILARNIEYEYLLTGCDLDADMIINKSRRKRIISVRRREIEIIAPIESSSLPKDWKNLPKADISSRYVENKVFVMIANKPEGKKAVLFEPTEQMKDVFRKKLPGKYFEE